MRILITFALNMEFAAWCKIHPFVRLTGGEFARHEGTFGGVQVRVVLTGVGVMHAARVAHSALQWRPDVCITGGGGG